MARRKYEDQNESTSPRHRGVGEKGEVRRKLIQFYRERDPGRAPDLAKHVDSLLANYELEGIAQSLRKKYGDPIPPTLERYAKNKSSRDIADAVRRVADKLGFTLEQDDEGEWDDEEQPQERAPGWSDRVG
jgi:hypothetical protein